MSLVKEGQKSVRVVLPETMYDKLKSECPDHGDLSRLIRSLLRKHLVSLGVMQAAPTGDSQS